MRVHEPQRPKFLAGRAQVSQNTVEIEPIANAVKSQPDWLIEFVPRRGLSNGHLQTIVGNFLPRPALNIETTAEEILVDPVDGSRVLCHCHWQPEEIRAERLTVVLVHGLEGSSNSRYIQGVTARAWAAGYNVVRMNMRNCCDTEQLTPTLYHSALSSDVGALIDYFSAKHGIARVALVGYSMGGNLVLKLAGEWGNKPPLVAAATVCPVIDLAPGSDALHEPANRLYEYRFLRGLMRRYRRKAALYPNLYAGDAPERVRSLREFDDKIVARYCGFRDADDYYYRAAAARVVHRIAVPTLVLLAKDDPFIRLLPETRLRVQANPHITLVETNHGGHCAFLSREAGNDRHWAEVTLIRYLQSVTDSKHER